MYSNFPVRIWIYHVWVWWFPLLYIEYKQLYLFNFVAKRFFCFSCEKIYRQTYTSFNQNIKRILWKTRCATNRAPLYHHLSQRQYQQKIKGFYSWISTRLLVVNEWNGAIQHLYILHIRVKNMTGLWTKKILHEIWFISEIWDVDTPVENCGSTN